MAVLSSQHWDFPVNNIPGHSKVLVCVFHSFLSFRLAKTDCAPKISSRILTLQFHPSPHHSSSCTCSGTAYSRESLQASPIACKTFQLCGSPDIQTIFKRQLCPLTKGKKWKIPFKMEMYQRNRDGLGMGRNWGTAKGRSFWNSLWWILVASQSAFFNKV